MKRIILILLITLSALNGFAQSDVFENGSLKFRKIASEAGSAYQYPRVDVVGLSAAAKSNSSMALRIPSTVYYGGTTYAVSAIEASAFQNETGIVEVTLESGVKTVLAYAFSGCTKLAKVYLGSSVKKVGNYAFSGCTALKEVSCAMYEPDKTGIVSSAFPSNSSMVLSVPKTNPNAFYAYASHPAFTKFTVISKVVSAYDFVLDKSILVCVTKEADKANTGELTIVGYVYNSQATTPGTLAPGASYQLSDYNYNLVAVSDSACIGNTSLTQVNMREATNLTKIGTAAFGGCSKLTKVLFGPALEEVGDNAFASCAITHPVYLPYGIKKLNGNCFANNKFTYIQIPSTISSIGKGFIKGCSNLQTVVLNSSGYSNTSYSWYFDNIPKSCSMYVPTGCVQQYKDSPWGNQFGVQAGSYDFVFGTQEAGSIYTFSVTSTSPVTFNGKTYDGTVKYVFNNYPTRLSLESFTIMNNIIDDNCGAYKHYLITEIGDSCFVDCRDLKNLDITAAKGLTRIGNYAFYLTSIESMTVPSSVTYIGKMAWVNCHKLKELTLLQQSGTRSWGGQFFGANAEDFVCYVKWTSLNSYMNSAASWSKTYVDTREMKDCFNGYFQMNNSNGCVGFSVNHPVDWSDMNIKAYAVSSYDASTKLAKTTKQNYTPANTGLILTGYENGTIYKLKRPSFTPSAGSNLLVGNAVATTDVYGVNVGYLFSGTDKNFWRPSSTYNLSVGYAYLKLTSAQAGSTSTINVDLFNTGVKGDVDGNGVVDITDANILINIVLGKDQASKYGGRADINGDATIDVSDINAVLNIILGK